MKKQLAVFLLGLSVTSSLWAASPSHISDEVTVFVHSGPSNQYRITGRFTSGETVTVLARNENSGYLHVRNESGKDGWVDGKFIKPGYSVKVRLPQVQAAYDQSQEKLTAQADELARLRVQLTEEQEARTGSTARIAQLENRIVELQGQIDGMDQTNLMRWFSYGGIVALGGLLLGLIVPYLPKKRRRNDDWF